jgi:hypothetical protein
VKTLICSVVVLCGAVAFAADKDEIGAKNCESTRKDLASKSANCPEIAKEGEAASCKNLDDFNAMTKRLKACAQLAVDAAMKKSADAKSGAGGSEKKCKAVSTDGKETLAEETGSLMDCIKKAKEKVIATKCTPGAKVEYLLQTEVTGGTWTKGTKSTATCPKK